MITFKNSKLHICVILIIQFFMGIYMAAVRLVNTDGQSFITLFFNAKDGEGIDITCGQFDLNLIMSVLNIIVSVPLIMSLFYKKYLTKCCYISTRQRKYFNFYSREIFNIFIVCILSEILYHAGIATVAAMKCGTAMDNSGALGLIAVSVINSVFILFTATLVGSIFSVLIGSKISVLVMAAAVTALSVMIFFIPSEYKQFNIMNWYFTYEFAYNKMLFPNPFYCYFAAAVGADILLILLGGYVLKKRDVI